jgi:pimeloyl-ACP methyl ester carboxylesterase
MQNREINLAENVLERRGCPLHYWTGGDEGQPWAVFTHGLCADHRSWSYQVALSGQKYRVLSYDVRGHGLSRPMGDPFIRI